MRVINKIYNLAKEHKNCSVEFSRKQKIVMCDDEYGLATLTFEKLKKHLGLAKQTQKKLIRGESQ